jgi:perosamine synthetase
MDTRPLFYPLHQQPPSARPREGLSEFGLACGPRSHLPTSNNIMLEDVDKVCAVIRSIMQNKNIFRKYEQRRRG